MSSSKSNTQSASNSDQSVTGNIDQSGTTNQTASSQPWQQSLPFLEGIMGAGTNLLPNVNQTLIDPTNGGAASFAAQVMRGEGAPGVDRSGYVTRALSGLQNAYGGYQGAFGNYQGANNDYQKSIGDYTNALNDYKGNYNTYQGQLQPFLSADYLDPTKVPGIQAALETIRNDVSNNVNGQFAGAGRDLSGMNTQTLARGITQGEAPVLLDQYNRNVATQRGAQDALFGAGGNIFQGAGALDQARGQRFNAATNVFNGAGNLFGAGKAVADAGNTAAGLLSGFAQQQFNNQMQGYNAANAAMNLQGQQINQPLNYLSGLAKIGVPIASLGTTSSGQTISDMLKNINMDTFTKANSVSNTTNTPSPLSIGMGILGMLL